MSHILAVFRGPGDNVYIIDDTMRIWKINMSSSFPNVYQVHTLPYGVIDLP